MNKVNLIKMAKKLKNTLKKRSPAYMSYCRKIDRIMTNEKVCAMTFDDGPTRSMDLTKTLVKTLNAFNAKGTFDIIGTTKNNYPDKIGKISTPSWGGISYDHYPKFNDDKNAGAVNCPELIEFILNSGHEITNHTYSHILFGKKNIIYSSRKTFNSYDEVYNDVNKLHNHIKDKYNIEMKFSRPPHYVDNIKGGLSSYDVYSSLGYDYLCASFDGAGWLPCENEEDEVEAMLTSLKNTLSKNSNALCGQIIFQKDGFNMALRAPVIKGLKKQLEILEEYGYKVVTVTELLQFSPFKDVNSDDCDFMLFCKLLKSKPIAYNDNTLSPERIMTVGELAMLTAPKAYTVNKRIEMIKNKTHIPYRFKAIHPYSGAMLWCIENDFFAPDIRIDAKLTYADLSSFSDIITIKENVPLTRRNIFKGLK